METKLERQLRAATEARVSAVSCNAARLRDGKPSGTVVDHPRPLIRTRDLLSWNPVVCSSMVVRADVLRCCGGFPEDPGHCAIEDYALWLRVGTITDIAYVPENLVVYWDVPAASVRAHTGMNADEQRLVSKVYLGQLKRPRARSFRSRRSWVGDEVAVDGDAEGLG